MASGLVERKLTEIISSEASSQNTLEKILGDKVIKTLGSSKDGELSKAQIALVSSTV